jgi:hypothetical protein
MRILPVLVAIFALAASPLVAAQSATVPTDDVGHTGTDTAVTQTVPTDDVGHTGTDTAVSGTIPTDDVGHTGTDTAVSGTVPTDDVGHTGTDTVTTTTTTAPPPTPHLSLQPASSSMVGPNTMKVTAIMSADPSAPSASYSYSVPLASSDPSCTLPASVNVDWTSAQGGMASFAVTCAKVSVTKTVTISSGSATASFSLKRK